jgi:hypothetical protein
MADNVILPGTGASVATDDVAVNGGSSAQVQYVKLVDGTANGTAGLPGDVTNGLDVDVTRIIPGTTATSLGKAEDAVAGSGDTGVFMLAVRRDTPTSGAAAGDYHELEVDAAGRLWTTGTQIEDAAAGSGDTGTFILAVRRDSATSGAAAGDYHELQVDALGRLRTIDAVNEVQPSNSTTTALDNDGPVVKGSAGTLYGFQGYADAAGFVQVHNKATAPASTNVPVIVIPVASGAAFSLDLGVRGRAFSTGIAFGFSSTGPTYTDGGSHLWVDAQYT